MGRKKRLLEKYRKQIKIKNRNKNKIARKSRKRNKGKQKMNRKLANLLTVLLLERFEKLTGMKAP